MCGYLVNFLELSIVVGMCGVLIGEDTQRGSVFGPNFCFQSLLLVHSFNVNTHSVYALESWKHACIG